MALFSECKQECAQKLLDSAEIVRDAMFQQQCSSPTANSTAFIDLPIPPT
jgi:hypothetical protein